MEHPYPPVLSTMLLAMVAPDDRRLIVKNTRGLQVGTVLALGEELVLLRRIDDDAGEVEVDRGYFRTRAAAHDGGTTIGIVGVGIPGVA